MKRTLLLAVYQAPISLPDSMPAKQEPAFNGFVFAFLRREGLLLLLRCHKADCPRDHGETLGIVPELIPDLTIQRASMRHASTRMVRVERREIRELQVHLCRIAEAVRVRTQWMELQPVEQLTEFDG